MGTTYVALEETLTHPCIGACSVPLMALFRVHAIAQLHNLGEHCQELCPHVAMMGGRVVLRPIIRIIERSGAPIKTELFLVHPAVSEPVKPHVHRFCALRLDFAVDDALRSRVVRLHGSRWLRMPHLLENGAHLNRLSGVYVEGAELGLRGRRHDCPNDFGDVEYRTVVWGILHVFGKEMMATCSASSVVFV